MEKNVKNDLLRRARDARGWTQFELGEKVGVSEKAVGSWERGERNPGAVSRRHLCEIFGKTAAELGLELNDDEQPLQAELGLEPNNDEQPLQAELGLEPSDDEQPLQEEQPTVRTPVERDPNHVRMLKRVQTCWISGFLDRSQEQYEGALMPLRLQECSVAVINPWSAVAQESNAPSRPLPHETPILDVYDEADGSLLILGAPGAGKTTLLLQLARVLIARAEADVHHPLPVVFNLTSWAEKRSPLPTWLVDELQVKYRVPRSLAQTWVSANHILPLLDGLDEMAEEYRAESVQAINRYRHDQSFVSLVVCSRASEYFDLDTRLALNNAVIIEPLSWEEIECYLSKADESLQRVLIALKSDASLREMASTPLMLHIMAQTFSVTSIEDILALHDEAKRRAMIFEKYVEVVLKRRGQESRYSSEQTIRWLTWLAKTMQEHNQSEFYLERMQPDWLSNIHIRQKYHLMVKRTIFGLSTFVSAGLFALFRGDSFPDQPGLFYWLGGGKGSSVLGWMQTGLGPYLKGALSMTLIFAIVSVLISVLAEVRIFFPAPKALRRAAWNAVRYGALVGGGCGAFATFIFSRTLEWNIALLRGIILTFSTCFYIPLLVGLATFLKFERKPKHDTIKSLHPFLDGCIDFLFVCMCGAIGFTSLYALQSGTLFNSIVLANASITSFFFGLLFIVTGETELVHIDLEILPAETVAWSWQNVQAGLVGNVRRGVMLGSVILFIFTLAATGVSTFFYGIHYGLPYGVVFGSITGFITGITSILTSVLTGGWESSLITDEHLFIHPNEGIRRSLYHALLAACVFGPVGGIVSGAMSGFAFALTGIAGWFILGIGFSIIFSALLAFHFFIRYGGIAVISHYVLRWYLWRSRSLPLDVVHFLNYAAGRIFLRKVGGGYIFTHRLLQEYFASLE